MTRHPDATTTSTCPSCGLEFVHLLTRRRVWCSTECRDDALGRMPRPEPEPVSPVGDIEPDDDDPPPVLGLEVWPADRWFA
jgi:hypothetical protein